MIDTINTICKEIAPGLDLSEALVKKVYAHYWKTVKQSVASGKYTSIWLRSIGTLAVSRTKVRKHIEKLISKIRAIKAGKAAAYTRKTQDQMLIEAMRDLALMCARRNEIAIAYCANLARIQERYDAKTKRHLGQQAPDITGSYQQGVQSSQDLGPGETESVQEVPL